MKIIYPGLLVPATAAFVMLMAFLSCQKNDLHDLSHADDSGEIAALREAVASSTGTPIEKVMYLQSKKYFIVDEDSYVTLEDALLRFGRKSSERPGLCNAATQRMSAYSVDTSRVYGIKIFADSTVPAAWVTALDLAIVHWNQTGSKVRMQRVAPSYPYTTLVTAIYEVSSSIARAAYPSYYKYPGNKITINTYHNGLSASKKEFSITHELGHTLGFNHTNETSGTLIPGTPATDPASVMNSVCVDWAGFSDYDLVAVKTIYPADTVYTPPPPPPPPPPSDTTSVPPPVSDTTTVPPPTKKGNGKNK